MVSMATCDALQAGYALQKIRTYLEDNKAGKDIFEAYDVIRDGYTRLMADRLREENIRLKSMIAKIENEKLKD